jgi:hypothetical protein
LGFYVEITLANLVVYAACAAANKLLTSLFLRAGLSTEDKAPVPRSSARGGCQTIAFDAGQQHVRTMSRGVFPHSHGATFAGTSPSHILGPRPLRATLGVKAVMIHRLTCRHASGVALGHRLQTGAAVERRKAVSAPERIKAVSERGGANAQENDESNQCPATMHGIPQQFSIRVENRLTSLLVSEVRTIRRSKGTAVAKLQRSLRSAETGDTRVGDSSAFRELQHLSPGATSSVS